MHKHVHRQNFWEKLKHCIVPPLIVVIAISLFTLVSEYPPVQKDQLIAEFCVSFYFVLYKLRQLEFLFKSHICYKDEFQSSKQF